jgi:hypothetical protein
MEKKGIGPQGLGLKGNNGYHIGSPANKNSLNKQLNYVTKTISNSKKKKSC